MPPVERRSPSSPPRFTRTRSLSILIGSLSLPGRLGMPCEGTVRRVIAGAVAAAPAPVVRRRPAQHRRSTALWQALRGGRACAAVRFDFASDDIAACAPQAVAAIDLLPAGRAVVRRRLLVRRASSPSTVRRRARRRLGAGRAGRRQRAGRRSPPTRGRSSCCVPEHDQFCADAPERSTGWEATDRRAGRRRRPLPRRRDREGRRAGRRLAQRWPDGDAGGGHGRLGLGDGVLAEVEDRRRQHGVGAALERRPRRGARACRRRRWRSPARRRRRRRPG